jgi:hypothetical protein
VIKANRPRRFVVVTLVTALGLGAMGWAGLAYAGKRQQDAWQEGHAAVLRADCAAAVPDLETAASRLPGTAAGVAALAEADAARCARVQQVEDDNSGRPDAQLAAFTTLVALGDDEALHRLARGAGRRLLDANPPARLATDVVCRDVISVANLVATPGDGAPGLLGACVARVDRAGDSAAVSTLGAFFLKGHAQHPLATDVTARYAKALIGEARARAHPLGTAFEGPASDAPAGQGFIEIQNNTKRTMTVVISGPVSRIQTVPRCPGCRLVRQERGACVRGPQGKLQRFAVPPGRYTVLVGLHNETVYEPTSANTVGTWTVRAERFSRTCFITPE